ncbi:MAG: hypothetical protein IPO90_06975 [Flavobacteriales bacterium]|nr:hypothetical protein [Flavobacteriales bacterium]
MKQLFKHNSCVALALMCGLANGQVRTDQPVILNGIGDQDRQVQGLHDAAEPGDALNARSLQRGTYLYAEVDGSSLWQANLAPAITQAQAGLCLMLKCLQANSGPVTVSVNGSAPIPVVKQGGTALVTGDVAAGETVSLVHDGASFQITSARRLERKPCPNGTVQVNELYCIEVVERDTVDFPEAAVACGNADMQLCSWGQWYSACTRATTLGLQGMIGSWEWTNSAANSDGQARIVGFATCTQAAVAVGIGLVPYKFRCCYKR